MFRSLYQSSDSKSKVAGMAFGKRRRKRGIKQTLDLVITGYLEDRSNIKGAIKNKTNGINSQLITNKLIYSLLR